MSQATTRRQSLTVSRKRQIPRSAYRLLPPEGVPLGFQIAGVGARFWAQFTDILLTGGFVVALLFAISSFQEGAMPDGTWTTLFVLLFFVIRAPYYIATELLWNGQTVGKRMAGLRVINASGGPLEAHAVVSRNLMKELEVFVPVTFLLLAPAAGVWQTGLMLLWVLGLVMVPLGNARRQRLGDLVAGTIVIRQPKSMLLPDLANSAEPERFSFDAPQLDHYGNFELHTLERVLQAGPPYPSREVERRHVESLTVISEKIRRKIGYGEEVPAEATRDFLQDFYRAQRAHLEARRLFGDRREDKFHREKPRAD